MYDMRVLRTGNEDDKGDGSYGVGKEIFSFRVDRGSFESRSQRRTYVEKDWSRLT